MILIERRMLSPMNTGPDGLVTNGLIGSWCMVKDLRMRMMEGIGSTSGVILVK